jgi:hypothetical protein
VAMRMRPDKYMIIHPAEPNGLLAAIPEQPFAGPLADPNLRHTHTYRSRENGSGLMTRSMRM